MPFVDVQDRSAARLLLRRDSVLVLQQFALGEETIANVANSLQLPIKNVHYWAGRLETCGLIRCVRLEARAGRPIKHYTAAGTRFRVACEFLPEAPLVSEREQQIGSAMTRAFASHAPELFAGDLVLQFTPDGSILEHRETRDSPSSWTRTAVKTLRTMQLTRHEAASLAKELWEIADRYSRISEHRGEDPTRTDDALRIEFISGISHNSSR